MTTVTKLLCYHGTLAASTVDNVTIQNPVPTLTVVNRSGASEIYFTVDGVTVPTVAGDNTYVLPATIGSLTVQVPTSTTPTGGVTVKLISSGTPTYSVMVIV